MTGLIRKAWRMGVIQFLIVTVIAWGGFRWMMLHYERSDMPEIYEAALETWEPDAADQRELQALRIKGICLFRVNTLHVDGHRVRVLHHEANGYDECLICVPPNTFQKGKEYEIVVGKSYLVTLGEIYKSNKLRISL